MFSALHDTLSSAAVLFRAELIRHVYAARTYIVLGSLALATCACVFLIGGLIDSDFASLDLLFTFLPIVAIGVVPALGAGAFAAEGTGREFELMLSLPMTAGEIVLGKWLAGCVVLLAGLALTSPVALTVAYLGSPDWGTAVAGIAGAVLLLATFYAVTLLASAIAAQETTAYLLALFLLLALSAAGSDALASVVTLPASASDALRLVNPRLAAERLATGRVEAATVFSFLALTSAALFFTRLAIAWRRASSMSIIRGAGLVAGLAGAAGLAVALGTVVLGPVRAIDLTSERLYTFSAGTVDIARTVPRGTTIDLYWTASEPAVPAYIRDHARRVRQTMELLVKLSDGRLTLNVRDAIPDSEAEWQAVAAGLRRVPLTSGGSFILGAVLQQGERRHVIDYFDVERAGFAEYDLALALSRIGRQKVTKVGILSPLLAPSEMTEPGSRFAFLDALRAANDVAVIPFFAEALPEDLDVLVVIGEGPVKPAMLSAIDQHVMRDKGLVVLLDPLTRLDKTGRLVSRSAAATLVTISDLIGRYGMAFDANVTGDAEAAALIADAAGQPAAYPFFIAAGPGQISAAHPASAQIRRLLFLEPGSFALSGAAQALVVTSPSAGAVPASRLAGSPADNGAAFTADGKLRVLAAVSAGGLDSAFRENRTGTAANGRLQRSKGASVIAVADVDWVLDGAARSGAEAGRGRSDNDNLIFFSNLVEAAGGDRRLTSIASRTPQSRRFTRVANMLAAAQAHTQAEDAASRSVIDKVENTVAEILKATKVRSIADLPPDVRAKIGALYAETLPARKRQREIRLSMRQSVEQLSLRLTALNLAFGPLAALMLWGLARVSQRRGARHEVRRETSIAEPR